MRNRIPALPCWSRRQSRRTDTERDDGRAGLNQRLTTGEPAPTARPGGLAGWWSAYLAPLRRAVATRGVLRAAPVTLVLVTLTLLVSAAWLLPGAGHRLAAACCAYHGADLTGGAPWRLAGGALLLRAPVEWSWTLLAGVLVLAVYETAAGPRRLLLAAVLGHVVPTLTLGLTGALAGHSADLAALDVGSSGVVTATVAAMAVRRRSALLAAAMGAGLLGDIALLGDVTTIGHLLNVPFGMAAALPLPPRAAGPTGAPDPWSPPWPLPT